jgi:L,D-transpeptidase catalytic domain/LysM domain
VNTLKSAALVIVLLGVLYGVYVALNKPEPLGQTASPGGDGAPLIEYGGSSSATSYPSSIPPLAGSQSDTPAPASRSVRGGDYQPNFDTGSMPPPTTAPPTSPPLEPATAAAASGLQRSGYESPASNPAAESSSTGSSSQPSALEPVSPATSARDAAPAIAAYDLRRDLAEAEQLVAAGKCKAALARLTPYYAKADLPGDQRAVLMSWLDALAAKVIYSREHCLASAHQVRKGETLYDVAHQYNVEYRLLQNINRREVSDPLVLVPATELKVVPGPFRADVNLTTCEVTLLVGDLYAGRFPFALGDQPPQPGDYRVVDKRSQQKTYVGYDGRVIAANDPNNPYGGWWISLGGDVAIHGSPASPSDKTLGCISLSPQDVTDIYGILSIGSDVKIRR